MILKIVEKQKPASGCAVCGTDNPFSLKTDFYRLEDGTEAAVAHPAEVHQSYPGRVHGGLITAMLDETIGRAVNIAEPEAWGVTGEITVRFLKPVPYGKEIFAVARITRSDRRIFEGEGVLYLEDGTVAATAKAKYLKLSFQTITGGDSGDIPGTVPLADGERKMLFVPDGVFEAVRR